MSKARLKVCFLTQKSDLILKASDMLKGSFPAIEIWQAKSEKELHDRPFDLVITDNNSLKTSENISVLNIIEPSEIEGYLADPSKDFITTDEICSHSIVRAVKNIIEKVNLASALKENSIKDDLTGVYNQRFILDLLSKEIKKSNRYSTPLTILLLGVDKMTEINEKHGHKVGDGVLIDLSLILSNSVRSVDAVGRYGGDEFLAILPETTLQNSLTVCARIQHAVKNLAFANSEPGLNVTVSIGIGSLTATIRTKEELIEASRQALLGAKKRGNGATCTWEESKQQDESLKEDVDLIKNVSHRIGILSSDAKRGYFQSLLRELEENYSFKKRQHHAERVAFYSERLALKLGLSPEDVSTIKYSALLHDIGLLAIDDRIVMKPNKLNGIEYALIKQHPVIASQMLANSHFMKNEINIILHHHEKFDGTGYPDHLQGSQISTGSRIIALAESWDTMISPQEYRDALSLDAALGELKKNSSKQFDPELVAIFSGMIEN